MDIYLREREIEIVHSLIIFMMVSHDIVSIVAVPRRKDAQLSVAYAASIIPSRPLVLF